MFEYYNETELLSLMLNQDEFLRYITQRYNENNCCTQLEPLIWAIHLNIPKYQRQPLLEKILHQSINYIKMRYNFLPEKQILGKTYEILGIPTICGEPDKYFLNAYKKYKSYYPLRCMNKKTTTPLNESVIYDSIDINICQNRSKKYQTPPTVNKEMNSSTPIKYKIPRFEFSSLLSPIRTPIEDENMILSTDNKLFYEDSNLKNIKNNKYGEQMSFIPKTLELSGVNVLNTSKLIFNNVQNLDSTDSKNMNDSQSQMLFISRNPKHIQVLNNTTLSYENDLSNMHSEDSLRSITKDENSSTTIYFNNLKRVERRKLKFETSKNLGLGKNNLEVSKNFLRKKIKTNLKNEGLKHLKHLQKTKTCRIKKKMNAKLRNCILDQKGINCRQRKNKCLVTYHFQILI